MGSESLWEDQEEISARHKVVDELILSFAHDREIDFMLPNIQPTGKFVGLPPVVVMKFKGNKIENEHVYQDQGSLLAQVGLLDPSKIPVVGADQAKELPDLQKGNQ